MAGIIHRIGIKAPASKVHDAVATAQGIAGWWSRDTTGSGNHVNVRFLKKDGTEIGAMDFELSRLEPDRAVQWRFTKGPEEWLPTTVTFDLARTATRRSPTMRLSIVATNGCLLAKRTCHLPSDNPDPGDHAESWSGE